MGSRDPRIDEYIDHKAADFARPILHHLRELVHAVCPGVEEKWKWSFPNFDYKGSGMCSMAGFKQHVAFSFWKAALMSDPDHVLETTEREAMGHLGRIESLKDLPEDAILKRYIKEAMRLNEDGVKMPARNKATDEQKKELAVPDYLTAALRDNKAAQQVFAGFPYSARKEYIEWLEDAKTDATRSKRLAQAIEWIAEGKGRHWKYKR